MRAVVRQIIKTMQGLGDPADAVQAQRFFKTGKGEYGEGDVFLCKHYSQMPRTMLRYAIETFPEPKRLSYLNGTR